MFTQNKVIGKVKELIIIFHKYFPKLENACMRETKDPVDSSKTDYNERNPYMSNSEGSI